MALSTVSFLSKSILPRPCQTSGFRAKSSICEIGIPVHCRIKATPAIVAQSMMGDHFDTLGLRRGASKKDIKTAYRRLALKYHPDTCKGDDCQLRFMQINTAYERTLNYISGSCDEYGMDDSEVERDILGDSWDDWEAELDYACQISMSQL